MPEIFADSAYSGQTHPLVTAAGLPILTEDGNPILAPIVPSIAAGIGYAYPLGALAAMTANRRVYSIFDYSGDDSFTEFTDQFNSGAMYRSENRLMFNSSYNLTWVESTEINTQNLAAQIKYISRRAAIEIGRDFDIAHWIAGSKIGDTSGIGDLPQLDFRDSSLSQLHLATLRARVSTTLYPTGSRPSTSLAYWSAGGILPIAFPTVKTGARIRMRGRLICDTFDHTFPLSASATGLRVYPMAGTWSNDTQSIRSVAVESGYYLPVSVAPNEYALAAGDDGFADLDFTVTVPESHIVLLDFGPLAHGLGYDMADALVAALAAASTSYANQFRHSAEIGVTITFHGYKDPDRPFAAPA